MKPKNDMRRLLYSRTEAAGFLSISVSTLDVCVARGLLGSRRLGRKVLIPTASLVAFSQKSLPRIWPAKVNGKTTRTGSPSSKEVKKIT